MAKNYGGGSEYDQQDEPYSSVPLYKPPTISANARYKQKNPNARLTDFQTWLDTQTGKEIQGSLSANDPNKIVTGFSRGNPQNTTSYDINTGERTEANPHPWLDALKNTAMIWGGPETAGALMGAWGGAGAASAAGGGSTAAPTGIGPSFATSTGGAAGTGGSSLGTQMATNAATNAAVSKLKGGSWKNALLAGAIGAGTVGLGKLTSGLGPTASKAANLGATQGISALGRLGGGGGGGNNGGANAPYSGGNAPGFSYSANNPNLADSLSRGVRMGLLNQPFRAGYTVPPIVNSGLPPVDMPPIYPNLAGRRR